MHTHVSRVVALPTFFGDTMSTPSGQTIHLSPENVVEISKNTLKPSGWKCEWIVSSTNTHSSCSIVLGSWNAYFKVSLFILFLIFSTIPHIREQKNILIFIFWPLTEIILSASSSTCSISMEQGGNFIAAYQNSN